jgi:hypothetical protein
MIIPIEIINKILVYIGELNNDIIIRQYYLSTDSTNLTNTNKEYYKINFNSNLLHRVKATLLMKQYYPIRSGNFSKGNIELYKFGIQHYEKKYQ